MLSLPTPLCRIKNRGEEKENNDTRLKIVFLISQIGGGGVGVTKTFSCLILTDPLSVSVFFTVSILVRSCVTVLVCQCINAPASVLLCYYASKSVYKSTSQCVTVLLC